MGRRDTKEVLYSEGNKKSQGAAAENMRVRERRADRLAPGSCVMLRISLEGQWGMVLSGGIMAVLQKIESGKG